MRNRSLQGVNEDFKCKRNDKSPLLDTFRLYTNHTLPIQNIDKVYACKVEIITRSISTVDINTILILR